MIYIRFADESWTAGMLMTDAPCARSYLRPASLLRGAISLTADAPSIQWRCFRWVWPVPNWVLTSRRSSLGMEIGCSEETPVSVKKWIKHSGEENPLEMLAFRPPAEGLERSFCVVLLGNGAPKASLSHRRRYCDGPSLWGIADGRCEWSCGAGVRQCGSTYIYIYIYILFIYIYNIK